jgi:hypothetical protein
MKQIIFLLCIFVFLQIQIASAQDQSAVTNSDSREVEAAKNPKTDAITDPKATAPAQNPFKVNVEGGVGPTANNVYDLGSNTNRWRDIYVGPHSLHIGTGTGNQATLSHSNTGGHSRLLIDADDNGTDDFYLEGNGNLSFTGALMPGDNAGSSGYFLKSAGSNSTPTWVDLHSYSWALDGNSGTDSTKFIGTKDNKDLNFRTNNITRMRIRKSTATGDSGSVEPYADNTYTLGTPTHRWKDVYVGPASLHIGGFISGSHSGSQDPQTVDEVTMSYDDGVLHVNKAITSSGGIVPDNTSIFSLGTPTQRWSELYLAGNSLHIGSSTTEAVISFDTAHQLLLINTNGTGAPEISVTSAGSMSLASLSAGGVVLASPGTGALGTGPDISALERVLTFTNGLTRSVNLIKLGGALTANTDIPLSTFNFTFSGGGKVGIGTTGVPASLFSVGSSSEFTVNSSGAIASATGISSSGTITFSGLGTGIVKSTGGTLSAATAGTDFESPLTFTNGLTRSSNTVSLGGSLTGATDVPLAGNNLTFSGTGKVGIGTTGAPSSLLSVGSSSQFTVNSSGAIASATGISSSGTITFSGVGTGMVKSTGGTLSAATAGTDFESPLTFTNGLTRSSNTVSMGGSLTGATDVPLAGNNLTFSGTGKVGIGTTGAPASLFSVGSSSQFTVNSSGAIASATGISSSGTITFSGIGTGMVKSTGGTLSAATAGTDFESPLTFTNGLTRSSNTVSLGGSLTGATDVPLAGNNLTFSGTGKVGIGTTGAPASLFSVGSSSQFTVNSSGAIASSTGISSSGAIAFSDLGTGIVMSTGGTLGLATAGTDYESPLTFTNGLTRSSNSVSLGGPLTGMTDISMEGYDLTFSGSGNVGIGTTGTPASLFSVGSSSEFTVNSSGAIASATGISSSGAIAFSDLGTGIVLSSGGTLGVATAGTDYETPLTFTNGLTRSSNTVSLGGSLTGSTDIPMGGYDLTFSGSGNIGIGTTGAPTSLLSVGPSSEFTVNGSGAIASATGISSSGAIAFSDLGTGIVMSTGGTLGVATAGTDYETPLTFTNGLTRSSNTVSLGGSLTGSTDVSLAGNNLTFSGNGKVGIGSASTPNTTLDVGGDIAFRFAGVTLSNGTNTGVDVGSASAVRITGPTAAFEIHGIAGGQDGKIIEVYNASGQTMRFINESSSEGTAGNRVTTGNGGATLEIKSPGMAKLIYDATDTRWIVSSSSREVTTPSPWAMNTYSSFGTTNQAGFTPDYSFNCHRVSSDDSISMYGIDAASAVDGTIVVLINVGANTITLENESSSAADPSYEIITGSGNSEVLSSNKSATLVYDATSQRWRIIGLR